MYGGGMEGRGGGKERQYTPKGSMSAGANQKPCLSDLPPHLKVMFEPRPPLEFKAPIVNPPSNPYSGIGGCVGLFEKGEPPARPFFEAPVDRKKRMREQLVKLNAEKNELMLSDWDPHSNPKSTENAYHTLFIGRLAYDTTDKKLRREMENYGAVKNVKMVVDLEGKPRGYAFVEFEREEDMTNAYRRADGKKIDGRRIVADVERGRTVRNWKPRRFGGGIEGRKALKSKKTLEEEKKLQQAGGGGGRSSYGPPRSSSGPPGDSRYGPPPGASRGGYESRAPPSDGRYGPGPTASGSGGDRRDRSRERAPRRADSRDRGRR